jgi:hypothetical protein
MFDIEAIDVMDEKARWRARDVSYYSGPWEKLRSLLPTFELTDFAVHPGAPSNPHLQVVMRTPRTRLEHAMPVGVVSNNYSLVQHVEIADLCFQGIADVGIKIADLRAELGMTELGEWMNLRVYFPEAYSFNGEAGDKMDLRLECFNSVDGSSRLIVLFGWVRLVCTNGLVIRETVTEIRDVHNQYLTLASVGDAISRGFSMIDADLDRVATWRRTKVEQNRIVPWADTRVTKAFGAKAACRVFNICASGHDVELVDPFASGPASAKPVKQTQRVPGSPLRSDNLFDVAQALSWVASRRKNPDERIAWQRQIPTLLSELAGRVG